MDVPRVVRRAGHVVAALRSVVALKRRLRRVRSLEDAVELAFSFRSGGITIVPAQRPGEILDLLRLIAAEPPRTVVEIGTNRGGSLFLLSRAVAHDATIVSVDLPGGPFGGGYSPTLKPLYHAFARRRQRIHLLRADSHDPATTARVGRLLRGRAIDLLFIDGDHTLEGVRADYELYAPLVRPGGLICFHDIVPDASDDVGVPAFWRDVSAGHETLEFVAEGPVSGMGIGVLRR